MTIQEILKEGINDLKENNIQDPISKARRLLAFSIKQEKEYLIANSEKELNQEEITRYIESIQRTIEGEPIQYILGKQEFMKLEFKVNENVLIPRPDTEILVEEVIEISKSIKEPLILDLCTGSGAVSISLAKNITDAFVVATDISKEALEIARINAKSNEVYEKVKFIESNIFDNIISSNNKFDIIVCNPPYIKSDELKELQEEVQKEPVLALDGGENGLDFYEQIVFTAGEYLNESGYLCFEIGYDQKEEVIALIKSSNQYIKIYSKKDLEGNDRIVTCQKA